jgi:predicted DNA binding CopG/RHH family protein
MKKKSKKDPHNFKYFDDEEKELIESIENAPDSYWQQSSEAELKKRKKILKEAADNFARKEERINIRLSKHDLRSIKMQASREGLPYQSLIASLITRYNNGMLVPRNFN